MPLVDDELQRTAHRCTSGQMRSHTLQTTARVNGTCLRLVIVSHANSRNRAHFFAVSAQVMRHILVSWAGGRQAAERSSDMPAATLGSCQLEFASLLVPHGHYRIDLGCFECRDEAGKQDNR